MMTAPVAPAPRRHFIASDTPAIDCLYEQNVAWQVASRPPNLSTVRLVEHARPASKLPTFQ